MLRSQELRKVNFQGDSLRLGMDWSVEDLGRPQVLVESVYGASHPGSFHLRSVMDAIEHAVLQKGGKPAAFFVTDVCDGIAQSHDGMQYSLVSREAMANMVEIHALAHPYDATVFVSSCDKAVPAHLIAMARLNLPAIHVPGGANISGPDYLSSDQLWSLGDRVQRGEAEAGELLEAQLYATPGCGACQFMGTASTMQVLSEALGLALPGTALIPTHLSILRREAARAGEQVLELLARRIVPRDILTMEAFENAIMVHAAVGGSTNATLHLPALAHEVGLKIDPGTFDRLQRDIPVLADVKTAGRFPTEYFWYAGAVPKIMERIRDRLHLDVLTVTGKTLGENLEDLRRAHFFGVTERFLMDRSARADDVIRPLHNPVFPEGDIAVLQGNVAPEGAVVKVRAVAAEMFVHEGPARVFECEEDALQAILNHQVAPGSVIVIRYEGPRASGMPELFHTTEALVHDAALASTTAIITDGRFSGASRGPCIGHISPEAFDGGPIAVLQDGDLLRIDIPQRRLQLVGTATGTLSEAEADALLQARLALWQAPPLQNPGGVLGLYRATAVSAMRGAFMDPAAAGASRAATKGARRQEV